MLDNKYAKAYKEVVEIIKHFPEDEYNKIPKEKIDYYNQNMDKSYEFTINPELDLSEQNISKEANAIIISLYQDYFATDEQKVKINEILRLNEAKAEDEKRKKYNPDGLFKKKDDADIQPKVEENTEETALVEYKENFFIRFKNFILRLLHIN